MLKEKIIKSITDNLPFEATKGQTEAIQKLGGFILDQNSESAMIIKGYAGTGKTTLIAGLVKTLTSLKIKTVLLAPTGRAAKVLNNYTGQKANTIHKVIYRQKSSKDGFGEFSINRNLFKNTIFIIDESSMLTNNVVPSSIFGSGSLLDDLFTFVLNGKDCRLILVGDTAQLPPVGFTESVALLKETLFNYINKVYETELSDIVRQEESSGILVNATFLRQNISNLEEYLPEFNLKGFNDIKRISGGELIEYITDSYDRNSIRETVIITRSNKRANKYNEGIRRTVLWKEEEISTGDYIMVVKNNYFWTKEEDSDLNFIANGDIAEIIKIHNYEDIYNFRFADVTLRFIEYNDFEIKTKIILNTLTVEGPALSAEDNKTLFYNILEDYKDVKGKKNQYNKIKENEYFNALQVKFSYAVTCHKAQGGQWKTVFIDQGYIKNDMIDIEYLRWLYTSLTRATEKVYLVNFNTSVFTFIE